MLLNIEQIVAATKLDARGVLAALLRTGYTDKCNTATYLGMSIHGLFQYKIGFDDMCFEDEQTCNVWVSYKADGLLYAEF